MNKKSGRILHFVLIAILVIAASSIIVYNSTTQPDNKGVDLEIGSANLQNKKEVLDNSNTAAQSTVDKQQPAAAISVPVIEPPKTLPEAKSVSKTNSTSASRGGSAAVNNKTKASSSKNSTGSKVKKSTASPKPAVFIVRSEGRSYSVTAEERNLMASLVSAEAEGESYEGKLAVATIVINRVTSGTFPGSVTQVIMGKESGYYQFTPVLDGRIKNAPSSDAVKAVDQVLAGYRSFPAKVMWFLNPEKSTSFWITDNKTYFKSIGNHEFYY